MKTEKIVNEAKLFHEFIMYKHDSINTSEAYCCALKMFLAYFENKSRPQDITADEIISYLLRIPNLHTRRNAHSAIKLYYNHKSSKEFSNKFRYIPYPKKPDTLPNPITKDEFILIINACDNIKHKCILMLPFDTGLRISEVRNLKLTDIDTFKMQIHIRGAKGKKDRIVKLSSILHNFICEYLENYTPKEYLFNGQFPEKELRYSEESCRAILKQCAKRAGLTRKVKFHDNRHGFAQTLLENGTDIGMIQDLLGHSNPKTTRIYCRMNNKIIQSTESPLEQIVKEGSNLQLSENNILQLENY